MITHKKCKSYALCGKFITSLDKVNDSNFLVTCPQCKILIINDLKTLNYYNRVKHNPANLNKSFLE